MSDEEIEAAMLELSECKEEDVAKHLTKALELVDVLYTERNKYRFLLERETKRTAELIRDNCSGM